MKWEERKAITQSFYGQGLSLSYLCFGRNLRVGRGMEKVYRVKRWRLQVCPDWRLGAWRNCRWAH
jgi:hypothetical protein